MASRPANPNGHKHTRETRMGHFFNSKLPLISRESQVNSFSGAKGGGHITRERRHDARIKMSAGKRMGIFRLGRCSCGEDPNTRGPGPLAQHPGSHHDSRHRGKEELPPGLSVSGTHRPHVLGGSSPGADSLAKKGGVGGGSLHPSGD